MMVHTKEELAIFGYTKLMLYRTTRERFVE
jgi:hypothetical protein